MTPKAFASDSSDDRLCYGMMPDGRFDTKWPALTRNGIGLLIGKNFDIAGRFGDPFGHHGFNRYSQFVLPD